MLKKVACMRYVMLIDSKNLISKWGAITNDEYDVVQYKFIHINLAKSVIQLNLRYETPKKHWLQLNFVL